MGRPLKFEYAEDILDRCFENPLFIFALEKGPFEVETLNERGMLLNKEEAIYVIEYAFYVFLFDKQMS